MDENTNNNYQPQEPVNEQPVSNPTPTPSMPEMEQKPKSKFLSYVIFLAIVALVVYYGYTFISVKNTSPASEEVPEEQTIGDNLGKIKDVGQTGNNGGDAAAVEANKAPVTFVISAGIADGAVLTSGDFKPNVEVKKVFVYNAAKDAWVLVYDGSRQLDLAQLSASGEKHELISVNLSAMNYKKVRVEFVDLFAVDQKGSQQVTRERTVDMGGVNILEGQNNEVNIRFDVEDMSRPVPEVVS